MKKNIRKVKLKDIAEIRFSLVDKNNETSSNVKWITVSNLLPNNVMNGCDDSVAALADERLKIIQGDIIIRRIAPSYINLIDEIEEDCYAFNNLIIIRAQRLVDSFYLAYYLNTHIDIIIKKAAKGTVMPTLGRNDLEEYEVALPDMASQKALGKLWYLSIERKKIAERIYELDNKKMKYLLRQYIKSAEDNK